MHSSLMSQLFPTSFAVMDNNILPDHTTCLCSSWSSHIYRASRMSYSCSFWCSRGYLHPWCLRVFAVVPCILNGTIPYLLILLKPVLLSHLILWLATGRHSQLNFPAGATETQPYGDRRTSQPVWPPSMIAQRWLPRLSPDGETIPCHRPGPPNGTPSFSFPCSWACGYGNSLPRSAAVRPSYTRGKEGRKHHYTDRPAPLQFISSFKNPLCCRWQGNSTSSCHLPNASVPASQANTFSQNPALVARASKLVCMA